MTLEIGYWLTVALVAIVAVIAFKLLAGSSVGQKVPGLTELGSFI